jgi:omega-6 fatty acid desaturase (delta-12 desaturase)
MTASGSVSPRGRGKSPARLAARRASQDGATKSGAEVPARDGLRPVAPPKAEPPFSVAEVRAAIPAHCFERSAVKSLLHVAKDFAIAGAFFYAATFIGHDAVPLWARCLLWPLYWFAQGAILTGVWVLAHECGHQAFSDSTTLNNTVGWFLHSFLLVPYHSWRISHANHHKCVRPVAGGRR